MKMAKYIVEGANFLATVVVDEDIFTNDGSPFMDAYVEAATRTIENVFRHGPDNADEFDILLKRGDKPAFPILLGVCKEGELNNPKCMVPVSTSQAAQNAGVLELARKGKMLGWT